MQERGNALGRTRTSSNCFLPTEMLMVTKWTKKLACSFLAPHHWICVRLVHDLSLGSPVGCLEKGRGFRTHKRCRSPSAWSPLLCPQHICKPSTATQPIPRHPSHASCKALGRVHVPTRGKSNPFPSGQSWASCSRRCVTPSPTGPKQPTPSPSAAE